MAFEEKKIPQTTTKTNHMSKRVALYSLFYISIFIVVIFSSLHVFFKYLCFYKTYHLYLVFEISDIALTRASLLLLGQSSRGV